MKKLYAYSSLNVKFRQDWVTELLRLYLHNAGLNQYPSWSPNQSWCLIRHKLIDWLTCLTESQVLMHWIDFYLSNWKYIWGYYIPKSWFAWFKHILLIPDKLQWCITMITGKPVCEMYGIGILGTSEVWDNIPAIHNKPNIAQSYLTPTLLQS
jgi:hypothetical protein